MGIELISKADFDKRVADEIERALAASATGAARAIGANIKKRGRDSIKASWPGMSQKMANALRVDVYPIAGKASLAPAVFVHHNAKYSRVFEDESTRIKGRPFLWIAFPDVQARFGKKITPKEFVKRVGPLIPMKSKGRTPILGARFNVTAQGKIKKLKKNVQRLIRPVFWGTPAVTIKGKWGIEKISTEEWGTMPAIYTARMKGSNG